jgi:hypothetical protein
MNKFQFTELEEGEVVVFGPVTFTKTTSFSGGAGPQQGSVSKTSGHMVGVTNQRVIYEDLEAAEKAKTIQNDEVQKIFIKTKKRKGQETLTLEKVQSAAGSSIKLDLQGLPPGADSKLKELFPKAEISLEKGGGCGCPLTAALPIGLIALILVFFYLVAVVVGS